MGYHIKLLGVAQMTGRGLEQRMTPCLVPAESPLGQLQGGTNMVVLEGDSVGQIVLRGPGAGQGPTASAVMGDVIDIARGLRIPTFGIPARDLAAPIAARAATPAPYYLRMTLMDKPGALAKIAPAFLTLDGVGQAIQEIEWGSDLKVASARKAFDRLETREVKTTEGNSEIPYSFEMPKWWEMREGVTIPAIPIGKPKEGGQGYVPERNPYFKKFTTRTMRPVIDFDTCVKCNLCWISCPDSCFDVTLDGLYDANMEACCGCGVCEAVCPAKDCVTMVREDAFEDNASQWEMWRKDKGKYKTWMTDKIHSKEHITRSHGFRFRGQYAEEIKRELETGGIEITAGIPGENAEAKK